MDYYDDYDRNLMEYENELYRDPEEESEIENEIDSEIEDKLLSAIHYSTDLIKNNNNNNNNPTQNANSKIQSKTITQKELNKDSNNTSINKNKENLSSETKIQKPNIINSKNVIPPSIYNKTKTNNFSKSDLASIYNLSNNENDDDDNSHVQNNSDNDIDNDEDEDDINKPNVINDDLEEKSKLEYLSTNLNNNNNKDNVKNNDNNFNNDNNDIFIDLTNQSLNDLNIRTIDSENVEKENNKDSEEYITHIILPNTLDENKSVTSTTTPVTENFEEDIDNNQNTPRYFAPQVKKEIVCYFCRQPGHLSADCDQKKTLCPICKENHDPLKCPYSNACLKCACIGHQSRDCPNLWQKQDCKFCYEIHNTVSCPYLWRRYRINIHASKYKLTVNRYCYNCGLKGHFGDDCEERRYNKVFKVSAQSIKNEDPTPITNEELEAWHFDREKQNSFSLKKKHNHNHNSNNNNSSSNRHNYQNSNRNYTNHDNYDYYDDNNNNKRNRNRKRSRNNDDSYYVNDKNDNSYKYDNKHNKSKWSHENNNYNHNNKGKHIRKNSNNNNNNNDNYDNRNKKRKSNYSFNSTKPSIKSRLNI
ncbi:hypothetical protein BCR32DRAFT_294506 [Anaeromyces robustus]|uniref:CCHC-type domain-containing protein n=1 Tax=Anaeromyces robustus TaxID=1754192 RepID=A0A1Y1X100_9FUNG|nr:hypothetical protein BCR32DRAFT_294506 [Anaeromyces robustus]|eukprot:ORX79372.1 hypothetical protein BCR32DRAFT_294506 [Anaeromyces robustus]